MALKLAVVTSHPIQHFAPWHREIARLGGVDLRVFFCCDWGVNEYLDPEFQIKIKWDIPLLEGYEHEFLPMPRRPERLSFWEVDNPTVGAALDRFAPDVVQVFGYARRTNWRTVGWAKRRSVPVLLYSDSNVKTDVSLWRRAAKRVVVRRFYDRVDGAFYCGDNNRDYHRRYGLPPERLFPGGDPSFSTDQNPSQVCYQIPGTFDVTLITTNAGGNDTLMLTDYITVYPTPPFPTIV